MIQCPVCQAQCQGKTVCPQCGFDESLDYEHYPTLAVVGGAEPVSVKRARWQKAQAELVHCPSCGGTGFSCLRANGQLLCQTCGTRVAPELLRRSIQPKDAREPSSKPARKKVIWAIVIIVVLVAAGALLFWNANRVQTVGFQESTTNQGISVSIYGYWLEQSTEALHLYADLILESDKYEDWSVSSVSYFLSINKNSTPGIGTISDESSGVYWLELCVDDTSVLEASDNTVYLEINSIALENEAGEIMWIDGSWAFEFTMSFTS